MLDVLDINPKATYRDETVNIGEKDAELELAGRRPRGRTKQRLVDVVHEVSWYGKGCAN